MVPFCPFCFRVPLSTESWEKGYPCYRGAFEEPSHFVIVLQVSASVFMACSVIFWGSGVVHDSTPDIRVKAIVRFCEGMASRGLGEWLHVLQCIGTFLVVY